jgi:hypothetical protein
MPKKSSPNSPKNIDKNKISIETGEVKSKEVNDEPQNIEPKFRIGSFSELISR